MNDDYFTLEMADKQLVKIKPHVEAARKLKREIECIYAGYDYDEVLLQHEKPRISALSQKLARKLELVEELGGYFKDIDIGIVNFLTVFEGRDVFFSWKLGELKIKYWHELNETFGCRQPICDLDQAYFDFDPPERFKSRRRKKV